GGPRVRPGMPEDTSAKSQDQSSQGLTSGMPGKARKSNGRTRHPGGTLALFLNGVSSRGDEEGTGRVGNAGESGHGRRPRTLAGVVRPPTAGACPPAGTPPLLSPCPARRMSSSTLAGWRPSLSLRAVTISPCGMVEHTSLKRERRMRRPSLALQACVPHHPARSFRYVIDCTKSTNSSAAGTIWKTGAPYFPEGRSGARRGGPAGRCRRSCGPRRRGPLFSLFDHGPALPAAGPHDPEHLVEAVGQEVGVVLRQAHRRLDPERVAVQPALAQ